MGSGTDMWFDTALHFLTLSLEAAGVAVIVIGAIFALLRSWRATREAHPIADRDQRPYQLFRRTLGRAILLGLEFLVAADIIGTVAVEATLDNVLVLALIVLIRTFLSISLTVEIEGRWPWQAPKSGGPDKEAKDPAHFPAVR
ncbi:DUF1622 domain-containing protein [Tianweitania sediminis]|uniref:DUF1622 domain-containing protein n=1 Tax=Tianweitania sediminis TaxID=1502156 RepID=A0A8J7R4A9_9HYPH|nr:DUF1622 domain-containing protein [Tianweitania sediminis]MBP0440878.1 DUF1622 domain-containing protein [Tianweitania sediminis]